MYILACSMKFSIFMTAPYKSKKTWRKKCFWFPLNHYKCELIMLYSVTEPTAREDFKKYILISWEIDMIFNKVHEKQWRGTL